MGMNVWGVGKWGNVRNSEGVGGGEVKGVEGRCKGKVWGIWGVVGRIGVRI
jgi:hypothetical protein